MICFEEMSLSKSIFAKVRKGNPVRKIDHNTTLLTPTDTFTAADLRKPKKLKSLHIAITTIKASSFSVNQTYPFFDTLEELILEQPPPGLLEALMKRLKNLKTLKLIDCTSSLESIRDCECFYTVTTLRLVNCDIDMLSKFTNVTDLDLSWETNVHHLDFLKSKGHPFHSSVLRLNIMHSCVTDDHLQHFRQIKMLFIDGTNVTLSFINLRHPLVHSLTFLSASRTIYTGHLNLITFMSPDESYRIVPVTSFVKQEIPYWSGDMERNSLLSREIQSQNTLLTSVRDSKMTKYINPTILDPHPHHTRTGSDTSPVESDDDSETASDGSIESKRPEFYSDVSWSDTDYDEKLMTAMSKKGIKPFGKDEENPDGLKDLERYMSTLSKPDRQNDPIVKNFFRKGKKLQERQEEYDRRHSHHKLKRSHSSHPSHLSQSKTDAKSDLDSESEKPSKLRQDTLPTEMMRPFTARRCDDIDAFDSDASTEYLSDAEYYKRVNIIARLAYKKTGKTKLIDYPSGDEIIRDPLTIQRKLKGSSLSSRVTKMFAKMKLKPKENPRDNGEFQQR